MDWLRPLVALVTLTVAVGVLGAAVTLATRTVVSDGGLNAPAVGALVVVALAVVLAVAAGRRSRGWIANPDSYW